MLKTAIPVFHVSDSLAAKELYCRGLGFSLQFCKRDGSSGMCYMGVVRDGVVLHL